VLLGGCGYGRGWVLNWRVRYLLHLEEEVGSSSQRDSRYLEGSVGGWSGGRYEAWTLERWVMRGLW